MTPCKSEPFLPVIAKESPEESPSQGAGSSHVANAEASSEEPKEGGSEGSLVDRTGEMGVNDDSQGASANGEVEVWNSGLPWTVLLG